MRLLIVDQFSELGGAQQCLLDLLPAIEARGWQASIGLPGTGPLVGRVREKGFEVCPIELPPVSQGRKTLSDVGRFLLASPRLAKRIRELGEYAGADVVYVNGPRVLPAAAQSGRPVVFHSHSFLRPGPVRTVSGLALREAGARVIGSCRFVAEPWKRFVGEDRVHVVYNGVAAGPELRPGNSAGPPMVGCIGRIAPEKGQLEFAKVAALIHAAREDCRFVIYGAAVISEPGYEQAVRDGARGLPIEFAGWTCDVPGALQKLDLLLAPSGPHEATTRTILEAFAAGTPVVAFASGGIPEVMEHGRTGVLASGPEEMAQQALALLGDAEQRRAIAAAAREEWRMRFRLEDWQTGVLDFLATL